MAKDFAAVKAAMFGTFHLDAYRARRLSEGAASATVNRELTWSGRRSSRRSMLNRRQ